MSDRPNMTSAVYRGRQTIKKQKSNKTNSVVSIICECMCAGIFRMVFRHRRHDFGLRHMCLHLYGHRAMSLTGFYKRLMHSRRQTVRRSCGHRAVSAAVHRKRTDIARRPCCFRTEAGQRSYGGCVIRVYFWKIVYQTCTTTHF